MATSNLKRARQNKKVPKTSAASDRRRAEFFCIQQAYRERMPIVKGRQSKRLPRDRDLFNAIADAATLFSRPEDPAYPDESLSCHLYRVVRLVRLTAELQPLHPNVNALLKSGIDRLERSLLSLQPAEGGSR